MKYHKQEIALLYLKMKKQLVKLGKLVLLMRKLTNDLKKHV